MNNSRNPHPQPSTTNIQLLRGLFEITFTWPLLWMLRVTYFGNEPSFWWRGSIFKKSPTPTELALLLRKVAVKFLWTLLDPCWAFQDMLPARCSIFSYTKVAKSKCGFGIQLHQFLLRQLKRFRLPAVHPLLLPEDTSLVTAAVKLNKCQLLAQQLLVCPSWPELFNKESQPICQNPYFHGRERIMPRAQICHRKYSISKVWWNKDSWNRP